MANWDNTIWHDITKVNNGNEYTSRDSISSSDLNKIVENILYLKENMGTSGGGGTVQLYPPNATLSGTSLTISNSSSNGNFTDGYKVYVNDSLKQTINSSSSTTVNIGSYVSDSGEYIVKVTCFGEGFLESDPISLTYEKTRSISWTSGTPPQNSVDDGAGASTSSYAIFSGGRSTYAQDVSYKFTAYNANKQKTDLTATSAFGVVAASVGDNAIFLGGTNGWDMMSAFNKTIINNNLTSVSAVSMPNLDQYSCSAQTDEYAYFMGGIYESNENMAQNNIYRISSDLTVESLYLLSPISKGAATQCYYFGGTNKIAIAGGYKAEGILNDTIQIMRDSEPRPTETFVNITPRYDLSAGRVDEYTFFAGGRTSSSKTDLVEIYNSNFTETQANLSNARSRIGVATVNDEYIVFAGGEGQNAVDIWDKNLTKIDSSSYKLVSIPTYSAAATSLGNMAFFVADGTNIFELT